MTQFTTEELREWGWHLDPSGLGWKHIEVRQALRMMRDTSGEEERWPTLADARRLLEVMREAEEEERQGKGGKKWKGEN